jgi:hypothetical protein
MSNSEPSAIVLQGIPCMCGLYQFRFEWRKRFAQGSPRFTLSRSRMRSRTGLASPVENQACGIAKYPRLRVHRHEARMTPAKRRRVDRSSQLRIGALIALGVSPELSGDKGCRPFPRTPYSASGLLPSPRFG